jgi:3-hydroxyisobutyrate dehydrogenase
MKQIGFIGLGTMGRPMALNILNAGYPLRVYNRTKSKMEPLMAAGAQVADSCREAATGADVVITMVSDSADVQDVVLGADGALAGCHKGAVIIDMSTISPSVASEIAVACDEKGVKFLDAPVTGGETGAINATLSIMVGGDADTLESVQSVLAVVGDKITYMGLNGSGQSAKLCNQVICALNILAVSEGLAMGEAAGLDTSKLLEAVRGGAAGSWILDNLAPKMIARDWAPGFRVTLQQKDVRLALEAAAQHLLPLFGTSASHQVMRVAEAKGWGDEGTQAIIKAVKAIADRL